MKNANNKLAEIIRARNEIRYRIPLKPLKTPPHEEYAQFKFESSEETNLDNPTKLIRKEGTR